MLEFLEKSLDEKSKLTYKNTMTNHIKKDPKITRDVIINDLKKN